MESVLDVFKINIERHPDSSNVYHSYAERLVMQGKTKKVINYYEKAMSKTNDNAQKQRIDKTIKSLGS